LNLSLLVAAKTTLKIPVSCVEAGRWSHQSAEFRVEERALFSRARAKKAAGVSESMCYMGSHRSNQGEVWNDIAEKLDSMEVHSSTGAVSEAYRQRARDLDRFVDEFTAEEKQAGAIFHINGQLRGMELFDYSDTCSALLPKLLRSYALDAIDEMPEQSEQGILQNIDDFLEELKEAPTQSFDSLGEGQDIRLTGQGIAGGALVARDSNNRPMGRAKEAAGG
jgi:hypothetical protein